MTDKLLADVTPAALNLLVENTHIFLTDFADH